MRGHKAIVIDDFNGLWQRGDAENTPLDHFADCNNIISSGMQGVETRNGVGQYQNVALPLENIKRVYNFPRSDSNGLIVLTIDSATGDGSIYHVKNDTTTFGPLLTINGMEDFGFIPFNNRGYITPFKTYVIDGLNVEKGMNGEFLYVYLGAGAAARKAAGPIPAGTITPANGAAGHTDAGLHIFGVVGETDTGYLSAPCALASFTTGAALSVSFSTVPTFTGTYWTKRHIVASKVVINFNGDVTGYQLFFIPGATINDNVTTTLADISFYDADLLSDASHLTDNYSEIAAGNNLTLYHNRLCICGQYDSLSSIFISSPGEPEAINQIDGFVSMPPDGNIINNIQVLRDVLYGFKRSKTSAWSDNNDVPTTWPYIGIDDALGTCVHGVSTVLDSGSSNSDFLFIATYKGLMIFNGRYEPQELSWKIKENWNLMDRNEYRKIQIVNNPATQFIYYVKTNRTVMVGDYQNGLNPKSIKWFPWNFQFYVNTIAIVNIDSFILGGDQL